MTLLHFITTLLFAYLWIEAVTIAMQRGMVLGFVTKWRNKKVNDNIDETRYLRAIISQWRELTTYKHKRGDDTRHPINEYTKAYKKLLNKIVYIKRLRLIEKPLLTCTYCMSSIHGTFVFFLSFAALPCPSWEAAIFCFPFCVALLGLQVVVDRVIG